MKKVLIATTNNDKYETVYKIFTHTIFLEDEYTIEKMTDDMNIPEEKESGNNIERARTKALNAYNHLKDYNYDYIVGLDDAIIIKGRLEPNIKEYLKKILFEHYIDNGEEYAFNRAYCLIDKEGNIYETNIDVPYIYHDLKEELELKEKSYPLGHVSYPIGYDKPVCELNDQERIDYYLKYVKEKIMNLNIK